MLLAALALVLHGAARSIAHPVAIPLSTVGTSLVGHAHAGDAGQSRSHTHAHITHVHVHADHEHAVLNSHVEHGGSCQDAGREDGRSAAFGRALPGQDHTGLDCCTAVAAVVLPSSGGAQPRLPILAGVLAPGHAAELAGLNPDGPTKPPRAPYQG